jgi:hypothetical protein
MNSEKNYLHLNSDIPDIYKKCMLHIALEKADIQKDWKTFNILYRLNPSELKSHLKMSSLIFEYNYSKLSFEKQDEIFKVD